MGIADMEVEQDIIQKTHGYLDKGIHKEWRLERERCEDLIKQAPKYLSRTAMTKHEIACYLHKNINQTTQWLVWAVAEGVVNQYKRGSKVTYTAPAPWLHSLLWRNDYNVQGDVKIVMGVTSWM